jgi:hypothetical protein
VEADEDTDVEVGGDAGTGSDAGGATKSRRKTEGPDWRLERGGGSEWEPIKILLKNSAYAPNHFRRISHTLAKMMWSQRTY